MLEQSLTRLVSRLTALTCMLCNIVSEFIHLWSIVSGNMILTLPPILFFSAEVSDALLQHHDSCHFVYYLVSRYLVMNIWHVCLFRILVAVNT